MSNKSSKEDQMRRVFALARKGRGGVSPNPRVGAVIVSPDGATLGEGYHSEYGSAHAEVVAIQACAGKDIRGASLFINLEPCSHRGKTPPCCEAIVAAGIKRVIASMVDPNPKVNGRGFSCLSGEGIEFENGILEAEARYLNRGYLSYRVRSRAWCAVKIALSLDGRMAAQDGTSKWITGTEARQLAHTLRADHDGVLVGGGTVAADDPQLTVRSVEGPNPVRIVLSSRRGIPEGSYLRESIRDITTILITSNENAEYGAGIPGLNVIDLPANESGAIDPRRILEELPNHGVLSLLIEGGSEVLSSFMQAGVVDEISVGYAPSVIGKGISPFARFVPESWESRPRYVISSVKQYGEDVVITYLRGDLSFLPA